MQFNYQLNLSDRRVGSFGQGKKTYIRVYIYIYIYRERERERGGTLEIWTHVRDNFKIKLK